ncbi:hypothetical protein [Mucilaginibacter sp. CSA2-8R]|uniref:hypothetical protein n=1 Tax=Mucilaginibacter sp. CSA2-8R TaxID=3141542 RepID=UPI00315D82C2
MKKFLSNLWKGIQAFFTGIHPDLQDAIHTGVVITEAIKNFVDSPFADALTSLTKTTVDDKLKQALRLALPKILLQLKLAEAVAGQDDPQVITASAIKALQSLDGNIKSAMLHNLSILIAQVAADGKLSWSDGAYVLEWYYKQKFKAAA